MTTYTYLTPKSSREIQDKFVSWLNDHLIDPYEQAKNEKRNNFVSGDSFSLTGTNPKIHLDVTSFNINKIPSQSKTAYLDEEEHHFIIYYYNQKAHSYSFENGLELTDQAQCLEYLQYIRNTIKGKANKFKEYAHKITFGTIPKPTWNKASNTWIGMLPMTVTTYRR